MQGLVDMKLVVNPETGEVMESASADRVKRLLSHNGDG
jgi:hypothetical protein